MSAHALTRMCAVGNHRVGVSNCHSLSLSFALRLFLYTLFFFLSFWPSWWACVYGPFLRFSWAVMVFPPVSYICPSPFICVSAVSVSLPRLFYLSLCTYCCFTVLCLIFSFWDFIIGVSRVTCCGAIAFFVIHLFKCTNWLKLSFIR